MSAAPAPALALASAPILARCSGYPLTPAWLADELRHENMDDGPDTASSFLEDPTSAESLLVILGRTDGDIEIIQANELDVYTMAHGLYNFAELGFADEQADCFLHTTLALGPLEVETESLEASLVELKNRSVSREECEEAEATYEMYKMELDTTRAVLLAVKKQVRLAVVGSRKPRHVPILVRDLLRKYEVGDDEEGGL